MADAVSTMTKESMQSLMKEILAEVTAGKFDRAAELKGLERKIQEIEEEEARAEKARQKAAANDLSTWLKDCWRSCAVTSSRLVG